MALYRPSQGRNQRGQTPPQEPNLVPIMNLFMTIIPFLLQMIVISQVAMIALNFSSAGGGGGGGSEGGGSGGSEKEVKVIIMAREGNQMFPGFEIRETGVPSIFIRNSDFRGNYNYLALNNTLESIKKNNAELTETTIVVYPDVLYETLIKSIDLCKQNGFPNVIYKPATTYYGVGG